MDFIENASKDVENSHDIYLDETHFFLEFLNEISHNEGELRGHNSDDDDEDENLLNVSVNSVILNPNFNSTVLNDGHDEAANDSIGDIGEETLRDLNAVEKRENTINEQDSTFQADVTENEQRRRPVTRSTAVNFRPLSLNFAFLVRDPSTVSEAMGGDEAEHWKRAMQEEYDSLIGNHTWKLVNLPHGRKTIKCKWIFKTKTDEMGEIARYKARLVAKGCSQRPGIDFNETYSPVVRYSSIRFLVSIAAQHNLNIYQMDAITAFLQGDLEDEIYMDQPELFCDNSNRVCKLMKSIYGLKQASRQWNKKLSAVFISMGYQQSKIDPCVYSKFNNNDMIFVAIYVDDLMIFTNSIELEEESKASLMEKFKMKDLGEAKLCIGLRITKGNNSISLDQETYTKNMLEKFGMENCHPVKTPVDVSVKLSKEMEPKTEDERKEMAVVPYMEADIAFAVNQVSRFNNNPGKQHWIAVKRIFRYLNGTAKQKITYWGTTKTSEIFDYGDADWAGDLDKRRSCTGYIFIKNGGAISWNSKLQPTVAISTTEAEYMALAAATQEAIWLQQFFTEFWPTTKPFEIFCDNRSAISLSGNDAYHARTKHIDVKHHFLRQKIGDGTIKVTPISTDEMIADGMTKGLPIGKHIKCFANAGLNL